MNPFGLQLHFLSLAHQLIGTVAFHHTRTIGWRYLIDITHETLQHFLNLLTCDMSRRILLVHGMLHIITGRRGSQLERCRIFLRMLLQFLNLFGGPSRTENEHTGCQWIECSGMSDLHFITQVLGKHIADMG